MHKPWVGSRLAGFRLFRWRRVFSGSCLFQPANIFCLLFGHHAEVVLDGRQVGSVGGPYSLSW